MRLLTLVPLILSLWAPTLRAQDPALVAALAPILMTEDRRVLDVAVLGPALEHPEPAVRRAAVVAIGRIGLGAGVILVTPRLNDRDPGVVADAFFALGLIKDSGAVTAIAERLALRDTLTADALDEAATALARIGGSVAASLLRDVLGGTGALSYDRRAAMRPSAMLEAWRLGPLAPTEAILPFTRDTGVDFRWRSIYTLGRLAAPTAGEALLTALRDPSPLVREAAARGLTRRFADTTGLPHATVVAELQRALDDLSTGIRINALGAIATFRDSSVAARISGLLGDVDRNVRVAAAGALGSVPGSVAVGALDGTLGNQRGEWAVRRAALASLARIDTARFRPHAAAWLQSADVHDRLAALQAWGAVANASSEPFRVALTDRDPRVQVAGLAAWRQAAGAGDSTLRAAAAVAWQGGDAALRAAALPVLADTASDAVLDLLADAWRGGDAELREAALDALIRVARGDARFVGRLTTPNRRIFLERPDDPVLRGTAMRSLPLLGARWGGVAPIETGRTLQDYRDLVVRYALARENPRVVIDVAERGRIELELLGREAPLTVANFLRLVDRRYFDNVRWHRVVPNFVVQDGDPTGTGSGGPGWSIRDEINRRRYLGPMLGMALSGPNTGGSQWFINLSPQPHLDGGYTIFGQVTGGQAALARVLQGDVIRSIQRAGPT